MYGINIEHIKVKSLEIYLFFNGAFFWKYMRMFEKVHSLTIYILIISTFL